MRWNTQNWISQELTESFVVLRWRDTFVVRHLRRRPTSSVEVFARSGRKLQRSGHPFNILGCLAKSATDPLGFAEHPMSVLRHGKFISGLPQCHASETRLDSTIRR